MQHHVFGALGKPLYVLIWIYGIYFAATPLLLKLSPERRAARRPRVFSTRCSISACSRSCSGCSSGSRMCWKRSWRSGPQNPDSKLDDLFVPLLGKSLRVIVPVVGIIFALPILGLPPEYAGVAWQRHQHPADHRGGDHSVSGGEPRRKGRADGIRHQGRRQFAGAQDLYPGSRHQQGALRRHLPLHRRLDPDAVPGSAAIRHQHSGVGGRPRHHPRLRRAKDHFQPVRRLSDSP